MSAEYNTYIIEHVDNVKKAYMWLKDHNIIKEDILDQLNLHDASKYTDEEYKAYDDYFYGTKTKVVKEAFNYAWLHHIHHNPHHWQYWVLVNDDDGTVGLEMPENYVYEMICDHWAFSHKSGNLYEIFDWYKAHKKNMILHERTRKLYESILDKIKKELDEEEK
jgi:hypothetical protein